MKKSNQQMFIKTFLFLPVLFILTALLPLSAQADNLWENQVGMGTESNEVGFQFGETGGRENVKDIRFFLADVINIVLGFLGIIFLILVVYGGFLWMTANGNDSQISQAKSLLVAGIIGLVIVLASFALANFITEKIYNATLSTSTE